jgi:predicted MFS family arabinose efflux permease
MERIMAQAHCGSDPSRRAAAHALAAGLAASLVGIGLSRFAYTPLVPALISAGWFTPADTAYLGAANLAGYLAGALAARHLVAHMPARGVLRAMLIMATASFFASAEPPGFAWFLIWRLASGVAGGALMVLAAPAVLACLPPHRHGLASGVIFSGVGLGIVASGTLVPWLLYLGLVETWCGLGAVALLLSVLTWSGWPVTVPQPAAPAVTVRAPAPAALKALYVAYALNAVGLVPHMVFLVDFVARGLGRGLAAGAHDWVLFGVGATAGPVLAGWLADRIGFGPALRVALALQILGIAVPAMTGDGIVLAVSCLVVGACVPGIVPLALGRTQALVAGTDARRAAWSTATTAFALGQAGAAYGMSFLFAYSGRHAPLFAVGAGAVALALVIDLAVARSARGATRPSLPAGKPNAL